MFSTGRRAMLGFAAVMTCAIAAEAQQNAQQNNPRIGYVYPAGGRQGTEFQVVIGGQFLAGPNSVYLSGSGVRAIVANYVRPLTQREFNDLREEAKKLQEKRAAVFRNMRKQGGPKASPGGAPGMAWTAEDEAKAEEIREKTATYFKRRNNPTIAESVTLQVTIAADAEPGQRQLRLGTVLGLSNPLAFEIGQFPEYSEIEPKSSPRATFAKQANAGNLFKDSSSTRAETRITLPAVVNGQIMPGDVDRFRFKARQGQHLVIAASARKLIPYLADAVPGWFQATLALYDEQGNELAYDDDYRFNPDPVLHYEIPAEAEYVVAIKDAIYRGREDFVYRIALGEFPFVTSIFPLGGRAGTPTSVEVKGWNLPVSSLTWDANEISPGIYPLSVRRDQLVSNRVPFALDTLPELVEREPNNGPKGSQRITLPAIVNGRIDAPGDLDVFSFEGRKGDQIIAEVYGRRLNSPVDSILSLTDAAGRELAANDDHEDKGAGLTTHQADSLLSATLPGNGTYYVRLGDTQQKGGAEYGYRLRISPPKPDFQLRVVPSAINARVGSTVPITVYALRGDGFSGEIALSLRGTPPGFSLSGARVPAGQDQVRLTLTVPPLPRKEPVRLGLEGSATIQGRNVRRSGIPADDLMQAFMYQHLVTAADLQVTIIGRRGGQARVRIIADEPVKIPAGGTTQVRVAFPAKGPEGQVEFELSDPPEGIKIQDVSQTGGGMQLVIQGDGDKIKPGLQGNLIVTAFLVRTQTSQGKAQQRRIQIALLPAIPFEVVPN